MAANVLRICHLQPKCLLKVSPQFRLATRDSAHSAKHPKIGISADGLLAGLLPQPCGGPGRLSRPQQCNSRYPLPLGHLQERCPHLPGQEDTLPPQGLYIYRSDICMHKMPGIHCNICNVYTVCIYHLTTKSWPKVYRQ